MRLGQGGQQKRQQSWLIDSPFMTAARREAAAPGAREDPNRTEAGNDAGPETPRPQLALGTAGAGRAERPGASGGAPESICPSGGCGGLRAGRGAEGSVPSVTPRPGTNVLPPLSVPPPTSSISAARSPHRAHAAPPKNQTFAGPRGQPTPRGRGRARITHKTTPTAATRLMGQRTRLPRGHLGAGTGVRE